MDQPTIIHCEDDAMFTRRAALLLADIIRSAIVRHGKCILGLSGGSTPGPVYTLLAEQPDIDWSRVILFLMDDRHIPADDPKSNQFLLTSTLLRTAPVPHSQVLVPDTTLPVRAATDAYDLLLKDILRSGIDCIVLGMGDDGHIASLFPPLPDEAFGERCAIHTTTNRFDVHDRISVTIPVLTAARRAVFLLKGAEKKKVWDVMHESTDDATRWPAKAVLASVETAVFIG